MVAGGKVLTNGSGRAVESIHDEFPSLPVAERYPFSPKANIAMQGLGPCSSAKEGQSSTAAETNARFTRYLRFWLPVTRK